MHCESVLHRDLAARNVLLAPALGSSFESPTFTALLADFGLAKSLDSMELPDEGSTGEQFRGPYKYMAPESLRSLSSPSIEFSIKTDVWSYGVLIWEMLTRMEPFPTIGLYEAAHRIANEQLRLSPPPNSPSVCYFLFLFYLFVLLFV